MQNDKVKFKKIFILVVLIFVFLAVLRFYELDTLPGEWFGDINEVHEFVLDIYNGRWPYLFRLGNGPLYPYLAFPLLYIFRNQGYETYKYTSAVVSLIGLIPMYLFLVEMASRRIALISTFIMGVSFWYLVWSRLGNVQVVIPAVVSFYSFFLVRYYKRRKLRDILWAAVIASLGWYIYSATLIFPVVFLIFYFLIILSRRLVLRNIGEISMVTVTLILMALPFVLIVRKDPALFTNGYLGMKVMPVFSMDKTVLIQKLATYIKKNLLMFHKRGDAVFRWNVSERPHLDRISGFLMILGLVYFVRKKRLVWLFYILLSMFLLSLPSISPAIPEDEIPSNVRTIALVPFVYLLVGAGLVWLVERFKEFIPSKYIYKFVGVLLIFALLRDNSKLYFIDYAEGLPERNLAPSKYIAGYIDTFPSDYYVYLSSCCWGDWGQPEPAGIFYSLRKFKSYDESKRLVEKCDEITERPAVIIFSPHDENKLALFRECFSQSEEERIYVPDGREVAASIDLR